MRHISVNDEGDWFDYATQEWIRDEPKNGHCFRCNLVVSSYDFSCPECKGVVHDD